MRENNLPRLTYSHHGELHLLLHEDVLVVLRQEEGAVDGAAEHPRVIEGHVENVDGSYLNVAGFRPAPLQAVAEVFVEDFGAGVVIVENLRRGLVFQECSCNWREGFNVSMIHIQNFLYTAYNNIINETM